MRLINKKYKKVHYKKEKEKSTLVGCKKKGKRKKRYLSFHYQRHNIDFSDNMERSEPAALKSFIFTFLFFSHSIREHWNVTKRCVWFLHGKKKQKQNKKKPQKKQPLLSTDSGYRLVAQLDK